MCKIKQTSMRSLTIFIHEKVLPVQTQYIKILYSIASSQNTRKL